MKPTIFTREELYYFIWENSISEVIKKYDITLRDLKLICAKKLIPLPKLNTWKREVKYLPPLPDYHFDDNTISLNHRGSPIELLRKTQKNKNQKLHQLVEKAKISLRKSAERNQWRNLPHTERGELNIRASEIMIDRACEFMNAFIIKVENLGGKIELDSQYSNHACCINIKGQKFPFSLREKQTYSYETNDRGYEERKEIPSGILVFKHNTSYGEEWTESRNVPLETKLDKILDFFIREVNKKIKWERISQKKDKYKKFLKHVNEVKSDYRKKEIKKFKKLLYNASRWHQANIIRGYLSDIRKIHIKNVNISEKKLAWLRWADEKVEWFDPTTHTLDKYLREKDIEIENLDMFRSEKVEQKTYHYSSEYHYRR